jgi:hypothetical protein
MNPVSTRPDLHIGGATAVSTGLLLSWNTRTEKDRQPLLHPLIGWGSGEGGWRNVFELTRQWRFSAASPHPTAVQQSRLDEPIPKPVKR